MAMKAQDDATKCEIISWDSLMMLQCIKSV